MSFANVLGFILYLSSFQPTTPKTMNCIDYKLNRDVEDSLNQLFNTLKMPKESQYFKKSVQDLNLYILFKNIEKEKCKMLKDIVNISKVLDIDEEKYVSSNLVTLKLEESIEDTILNEFANYLPLIVQRANLESNLSLELITDISKRKVKSSIINETVVPVLNKTGDAVNIQNRRKNRLEVWENDITRRQIDNINIENYSFMVSVFENGEFVCTGCIIRKEMVITAASCLHKVYLNNEHWPAITLRVLSDYVYRGGYIISVTEAIFHPFYNHKIMKNNLVLLHVRKGAFTKLPTIKRLMYQDTDGIKVDENAAVKVLGWKDLNDSIIGTKHEDRTMNLEQLNVYNVNECKNFYNRRFISKLLCSGFKNSQSTRKYAIGSPSIKNSTLIGILSYTTERRMTKEVLMVFTRIAPYISWIQEAQQKILPILHGVGKKGRKGTLIKARRTGSRVLRYRSRNKNRNKKLTSRKTSEIISNGNFELNVSNIMNLVQTLSSNGGRDVIKNGFLESLVNSPGSLLDVAAQYLNPQQMPMGRFEIASSTYQTTTEKNELDLNWNVFFEEDGKKATSAEKLPYTRLVHNYEVVHTSTTPNRLENMSPEKETNSMNKKEENRQTLSSNEINDLAAIIMKEKRWRKERKGRIANRKNEKIHKNL